MACAGVHGPALRCTLMEMNGRAACTSYASMSAGLACTLEERIEYMDHLAATYQFRAIAVLASDARA
jgi:hypothetical protein